MLGFVLADLPVLDEIDSHIGARVVEGHIVDETKLSQGARLMP
jgi:hypothetical protein